MKKIILLSLLALAAVTTHAQSWLWAKNAAGSGSSSGGGVTTDEFGNTYSTGGFTGAVSFGTNNLTSPNDTGSAVFVVKYTAAGNVVWVRSAGGTASDEGAGICTDAAGNIYVTGIFQSPSITFGNTTLINTDTSGYRTNIFVVKYDSSGKVVWAKSGGGSPDNFIGSVCSYKSNSIYFEGSFQGSSFTFDSLTLNGYNSAYIIRLDTSGKIIWAKIAQASAESDADGVGVDDMGNIYVAGNFFGDSIRFDNLTATTDSFGANAIYIAKFDTLGNVLWLKTAFVTTASISFEQILGVDRNGYEYITCGFGDGPGANQYSVDVFIAKFDSLGNKLWANIYPGSYASLGSAAVTDNKGNVFIAGQFADSVITFGSYRLTNTSLGGASTDIFVVELNPAGNVLWAMSAGGTGYNEADGIASDGQGYIYVNGFFSSSSITFGSITLTNSSNKNDDFFIAKYGSATAGINEVANPNDLFLYPNPANNVVHVTTNNMQGAQLTICNMLGQVVYQSTITTAGTELNLSYLPPGMYLLKVQDGDEVHEGKLMLQ